jgi:hypothetical protein
MLNDEAIRRFTSYDSKLIVVNVVGDGVVFLLFCDLTFEIRYFDSREYISYVINLIL